MFSKVEHRLTAYKQKSNAPVIYDTSYIKIFFWKQQKLY